MTDREHGCWNAAEGEMEESEDCRVNVPQSQA